MPTSMLATLAHGILGLSKAAVNADPVTPDELNHRRQTCAACPAATRTKPLGRVPVTTLAPTSTCTACRCNLHAKTKLANESCPLGKW
ncbi:MAG: hypothetical protein AAF823_15710 [Planctomycetota bacterium]